MRQVKCLTCSGQGFVMAADRVEELGMTILMEVADRYGIPVALIQSGTRVVDVVRARSAAMQEMRAAGLALKVIGRLAGGRHHSTVIHALKKVV